MGMPFELPQQSRDAGTYADTADERVMRTDAQQIAHTVGNRSRVMTDHGSTTANRGRDLIADALMVPALALADDDDVVTKEWCGVTRAWIVVEHGTGFAVREEVQNFLGGIFVALPESRNARFTEDAARAVIRQMASTLLYAHRDAEQCLTELARYKDSMGGKDAVRAIVRNRERLAAKECEIDLARLRLDAALAWAERIGLDMFRKVETFGPDHPGRIQAEQEAARALYRERIAKIRAQKAQQLRPARV